MLVKSVFSVSSSIVYSFTGYNNVYGSNHVIDYSYSDLSIAYMIRRIRYVYGVYSPCEDLFCRVLSYIYHTSYFCAVHVWASGQSRSL